MHWVAKLWKKQPGEYFFLTTMGFSKASWKEHVFTRDRFDEIEEFIKERKHLHIYFCCHGFSKPKRNADYAVMPKMLWSDLDEADPRTMKFKPTIAIESSPGRHVGFWQTDKQVSGNLNKRMTYAVSGDKGGWDITQVLRVPGTINHKYQTKPRVKLLWEDGPTYKLAELEKVLPHAKQGSSRNEAYVNPNDQIALGADAINRNQKLIPLKLRQQLLGKVKTTVKDRSEFLWNTYNTLLESGVTPDDVFLIIRPSQFNKFSTRPNGDETLKAEIEKAVTYRLEQNLTNRPKLIGEDQSPEEEQEILHFYSMDEVEAKNIDWIWYPYLARGEVTILSGNPGSSKSFLAQMIGKDLCDGIALPSTRPLVKPGKMKVVFFDSENHPEHTTKKRLLANGMKNLGRFFQVTAPFSISDETVEEIVVPQLEKIKPDMIVFDTLMNYMGDADTHNASETIQRFSMFGQLAKRFNCCVMVLRHLTKGSKGQDALYRGQGSMAFTGVARVELTTGWIPDEDDVRGLAVVKSNLAPFPKARGYVIEKLPDTDQFTDMARFTWKEQLYDYTATEVQEAKPSASKDEGKIDRCVQWLKNYLSNKDEVNIRAIHRDCKKRGLEPSDVDIALERIGADRLNRGEAIFYRLPASS